MSGLFLDSWIFFPQFIAKVETAKDDRITMEVPTKWDEAPRGVALRALLGKLSLSRAAVELTVWATDSIDAAGMEVNRRSGGLWIRSDLFRLTPFLSLSWTSLYKLPQLPV